MKYFQVHIPPTNWPIEPICGCMLIIMSYSTIAIGIIVLLKMPSNIDKFSQLYIYMTHINFSSGRKSGQLHSQSSKHQKCLSNLQVSFGVNFGLLKYTDPLKIIFCTVIIISDPYNCIIFVVDLYFVVFLSTQDLLGHGCPSAIISSAFTPKKGLWRRRSSWCWRI